MRWEDRSPAGNGMVPPRWNINVPEKLVNAWYYIYGNWLPNSPYERELGVDFECYHQKTGQISIYVGIQNN